MSKKNDSLGKTIFVVVALCLVCSIIVSGAAIGLKPTQKKNAALDMQRNVLAAAGILEPGMDAAQVYNERVESMVVSLKDYTEVEGKDPTTFDNRKAASDPETSTDVPRSEDIASIGSREDITQIYIIRNQETNQPETVVLHIRGYGLWGTMYGLLALSADDMNTVKGLNFYEHGETPGLGGEITNPKWVQKWIGKKIYGDDGKVKIELVKGGASEDATYKVDALSGATLTSNGVEHLFQYWMGPNGYKPLLDKMREGALING